MTDKKLRQALEEIAGDAGLTAEEYLAFLLKEQNDKRMEKFQSYPEDVAKELTAAEKLKHDHRSAKREMAEKEAVAAEIAAFMKNFPGVPPQEIPGEVWEEVKNGVSLSHAFALALQKRGAGDSPEDAQNSVLPGEWPSDDAGAAARNAENAARALPLETGRFEPLSYSKEEVERMSPSAVKNNYKKILSSMKKWKF